MSDLSLGCFLVQLFLADSRVPWKYPGHFVCLFAWLVFCLLVCLLAWFLASFCLFVCFLACVGGWGGDSLRIKYPSPEIAP